MNITKTVLSVGSSYYFVLLMAYTFSKQLKSGEAVKILFNDFDPSLVDSIKSVAEQRGFSLEIHADVKPAYIVLIKN
ncbi:MAG: hypothetical protein QXD02_01760 [Candidatus Parvarchaeum sp.]|jgi:hypothetical protein|nr:hypothetical protein [Candidatus Parvarchaeota archaeon]MCW1295009.1 hypothetical protein [Candidatus Parvarchaeum tengchongense]MCW1295163.1 hypothetical protein [Candidatus Parvarchaeum tengchongense]MCW1299032.1 hypothetical protein [Candidatus Parvarchaeum tengchongense]